MKDGSIFHFSKFSYLQFLKLEAKRNFRWNFEVISQRNMLFWNKMLSMINKWTFNTTLYSWLRIIKTYLLVYTYSLLTLIWIRVFSKFTYQPFRLEYCLYRIIFTVFLFVWKSACFDQISIACCENYWRHVLPPITGTTIPAGVLWPSFSKSVTIYRWSWANNRNIVWHEGVVHQSD